MKAKGIAAAILAGAILAGPAAGQSRALDFQVAFGGWSLSPFVSPIERECERLIRNEFDGVVGSVLPGILLSSSLAGVDLSSSGHFFSLAAWYRLGESRFSAGVRGDYFDFRVPYALSADETVSLLGFPLVSLTGRARGSVHLSGIALSLLGRWTPLSTSRAELSLQAGLMVLPFEGDILSDLSATVRTPIGDLPVSGRFQQTIDAVRSLGVDAPSLILAPSLGLEFRYRFAPRLGLFLNATSSQGSFLSGGLFFSF
jgi:hypothetical protein